MPATSRPGDAPRPGGVTGARRVLCPELVGRAPEVARLHERLTGGAGGLGGLGGLVAIVGEAGSGKSRLVQEATAGLPEGALVLSGRAVPGDSPVAYRPLAEALLAAFRNEPLPDHPSLVGFEAYLGRLVPSWRTGTTADDSPLLVGEAVVRLLAATAPDGCVLVLEDLHWADPETLAVVEYLGDALAADPVRCIGTARPEGASADVLDRLERRAPGTVVRLGPLTEASVSEMVAACLGTPDPPAELDGFVWMHSDGSPYLVEELLAGLVAAGALRRDGARWTVTGPLTPSVPASLRDSIGRRLAALSDTDRKVLGAAALLGRQFEWDLLPGIAEVDGRAAVDALRAAVGEQLIEPEGDGFSFRHALTREAVLADLLPPERRDLAARAWPAVERAAPGLPGPTLQLAADLAEAAGERAAAAERLVESARRALDSGALASAEAAARRARTLVAATGTDTGTGTGTGTGSSATTGPRSSPAIDADEVLVHVLVAAGKTGDAIELGTDLATRLAGADAPVGRQVDLLLAVARAAVTSGRVPVATRAVDDARAACATEPPDPAVSARIDAVAADVALVDADLDPAEALARRAIEGAEATDQPAVLCEALLTLGRTIRPRDRSGAQAAFERAAAVADEAGLPRWHLRARQETALYLWNAGDTGALRETRALAARYGAHLTVAVMDLSLADIALSDYDHDRCLRAATDCIDASRRYGLATEPVAQLWLAGAHALAGDDDAMHVALDAARAPDPDDPRILGDLYGRVLVTRAFVRDELDDLPRLTDEMMVHVHRAAPTTSIFPGRALWALLHAADDEDGGVAARAEHHAAAAAYGLPILRLYDDLIEAVALGRTGDGAAADERLTPAYEALTTTDLSQGMTRSGMLVVARAAVRDGWGDPVRWLRGCEAWFAAHGFEHLVRRSRLLLGQAGATVPRRGRGDSEVPESLRALGVTSREVDVLKLVVAGRTTREIAAELFVSPKTVERHLTSLFGRTGVRNRRDLATLGAGHLA